MPLFIWLATAVVMVVIYSLIDKRIVSEFKIEDLFGEGLMGLGLALVIPSGCIALGIGDFLDPAGSKMEGFVVLPFGCGLAALFMTMTHRMKKEHERSAGATGPAKIVNEPASVDRTKKSTATSYTYAKAERKASPMDDSTHVKRDVPTDLVANPVASQPASVPAIELFDEDRILADLQKIAENRSRVGQYFDVLRKKYTSRREMELINQWHEQFKAGASLIRAKTDMVRASQEYRGLEREGRVKDAESEAIIAKHQADMEEHVTRGVKTLAERESIRNPSKTAPPLTQLSAEEQRANRHTNSEARLAKLKEEKHKALKLDDEQERILKVNAIDDEIQREMVDWSKTLP